MRSSLITDKNTKSSASSTMRKTTKGSCTTGSNVQASITPKTIPGSRQNTSAAQGQKSRNTGAITKDKLTSGRAHAALNHPEYCPLYKPINCHRKRKPEAPPPLAQTHDPIKNQELRIRIRN